MSHRKRKSHRHPAERSAEARPHAEGKAFWLYGVHAAKAALANPRRTVQRAVLTARGADELRGALRGIRVEPAAPEAISKLLPAGAVHQGIALLCDSLPELDLKAVLASSPDGNRIVAVLDQITDPHNEGAILRSAAAFGIAAVIVQDRHAPPESGALAKAASGALDIVPRIAVTNIARTLEELGEMNFWRIALAGEATAPLAEATRTGDIALVLGAEGDGVRRLVRERCDVAAYIPMNQAMESLNVSNAAAIAFYELAQRQKS